MIPKSDRKENTTELLYWKENGSLVRGALYLFLVQHEELISGVHAKTGVPAVVGWAVVQRRVINWALMQASVVGRVVVGGMFKGGLLEGRTVEGGTFMRETLEGRRLVRGTAVWRGVEGVGVGAGMMVMVIGGGNGTPCIWKGEGIKKGRRRKEEEKQGQLRCWDMILSSCEQLKPDRGWRNTITAGLQPAILLMIPYPSVISSITNNYLNFYIKKKLFKSEIHTPQFRCFYLSSLIQKGFQRRGESVCILDLYL